MGSSFISTAWLSRSDVFDHIVDHGDAIIDEFIAMRMQTELYNRLLSSPLSRKIGMMEILSEMEKLKVIRIGGTWHLSPVTPLQRSILEALDVPVPDDGSISRILSGGWRKRAPSDRT